MNILVIGNGFDLAHGLPTKYTDFLEFVRVIDQIVRVNDLKEWKNIKKNALCSKINSIIEKDIHNKREDWNAYEIMENWSGLIRNNFWFKYFLQCDVYGSENWIDFEGEIAKVIRCIDKKIKMCGAGLYNAEYDLRNRYMNELDFEYASIIKILEDLVDDKDKVKYLDVRSILEKDLLRLIRAFEWYLCRYVERMEIKKKSPDIYSINADCVLSFNYTNTFLRLYKIANKAKGKEVDYFDYIHGVANIKNTVETNNMVLGIDEYLPDEDRNRDINFIVFKKYYQRIYKGTGCKYKIWVDEIKESAKPIERKLRNEYPAQIPFKKFTDRYYIYIFGHSLDVTDKDIIRDLILNDNVYATIFYLNKDDLGTKIANLVKVIGQDELIRRTGGSTKTIEFKLQQDMMERE